MRKSSKRKKLPAELLWHDSPAGSCEYAEAVPQSRTECHPVQRRNVDVHLGTKLLDIHCGMDRSGCGTAVKRRCTQ